MRSWLRARRYPALTQLTHLGVIPPEYTTASLNVSCRDAVAEREEDGVERFVR